MTAVKAGTATITVTYEEWQYLIWTRTNASSLYKNDVTVCGKTKCLIIAPDGFAGTIAYSYDASTWPAAEAAGPLCLQPAGVRVDSDVQFSGERGYFWANSLSSDGIHAFEWFFDNNYIPEPSAKTSSSVSLSASLQM